MCLFVECSLKCAYKKFLAICVRFILLALWKPFCVYLWTLRKFLNDPFK